MKFKLMLFIKGAFGFVFPPVRGFLGLQGLVGTREALRIKVNLHLRQEKRKTTGGNTNPKAPLLINMTLSLRNVIS